MYRRTYVSWHAGRRYQRGFALLLALVFLLLMTMLAVGASRHALLQQRMAGSLRNAQQARMSAETALRGAEYKLWSIAHRPGARLHCLEGDISHDDGCVVYRPSSMSQTLYNKLVRFRSASDWIADIGVIYNGPNQTGYTNNTSQPTASLAKNPVYLIEDLGRERAPATDGPQESGNTGPNNQGRDEADIHVYRITARGAGGNPAVVSIAQSTFDAPVDP